MSTGTTTVGSMTVCASRKRTGSVQIYRHALCAVWQAVKPTSKVLQLPHLAGLHSSLWDVPQAPEILVSQRG